MDEERLGDAPLRTTYEMALAQALSADLPLPLTWGGLSVRRGPGAEVETSQPASFLPLPPCPREKPLGPWESSLVESTRAERGLPRTTPVPAAHR